MAKRTYDLMSAAYIYRDYEVKGTMFNYLSGDTWIPCDKTKRPTKVNYVYDESLDTFQAGFLSKTLDRKLPNKTFCRIIYEGYEPLYDELGRPTNHDVCVIANGTCTYYPNAYYYVHDYNLVELMHIMKDVRMETLSFTSQERISVKDPVSGNTFTYVKEPYNLYTIIERILKLTRTSTSLEDNSWWSKIQIMDEELLRASGIGVDDAFIENTLYDALFKIGHYIGRVPVLYLNKDYDPLVSGSKEFLLFFERKDGLGGPEITKEELFDRHKGWVESQVDGKDADTVVSDVHNMVSDRLCSYPSDDYYCFPTGEETLLELSVEDDRKLVLPHKIGEVISLKQLQIDSIIVPHGAKTFSNIPVYEYKNWLIATDRNDSAYFKEGDNVIYFGKNLAKPSKIDVSPEVKAIRFYLYNVKYFPMLDGKVISKKSDKVTYETTFNQVDNYLDASTYGNMLQEYINQHGQADITLRKRYEFTENNNDYMSIPKPGTIVRWPNGDKYLITNLSFDADVNGYECVYQLNKDYVRRNAYTEASQRIRNEGLNADKIYERFTNLNENVFVEITNSPTKTVVNNLKYLVDRKMILAGLISNQNEVIDNYIQAAYLNFYSTADVIEPLIATEHIDKCIVGNVAKSQFGMSVLLNVRFINNLNVTTKIIETKLPSGIWDAKPIQFQSHIRYTSPFGNVKTVSIGFGKFADIELNPGEESAYGDYALLFPEILFEDFSTFYNQSIIKIPELIYEKDLREIFNFTYQLHFKNYGDTVITDEFVKYCGLLGKREGNLYLRLIIINDDITISDNDLIYSSQIQIHLPIQGITYYNDSIQLQLSSSVNYNGKKFAIGYSIGNSIYKPLLISKWDWGSTNKLYIHV